MKVSVEKSWQAEMAESDLERGAKHILLLLTLRLTQVGIIDLGPDDEWLKWLQRCSGMSASQVQSRLKKAQEAGWITVARYQDARGGWTLRHLKTTKPYRGGADNGGQVFVSGSADTMIDDIISAIKTDGEERNIPLPLGWA